MTLWVKSYRPIEPIAPPDVGCCSKIGRGFASLRNVANYCESDVVNTYRLWLRHELFCGKLTDAAFKASEANLDEFIKARDQARSKEIHPQ